MTRSSTRSTRPRLAVFCSGSGTNLQAILDAVRLGHVPATLALVLADTSDAYALTRARRAGIPALAIDRTQYPSREAFERAILSALRAHRIRYIALAGFMRILSPAFVRKYRGRLINIHPALLPAFPGAHAVQDALRAGARRTGVTIHFVDEGVDTGPIIAQRGMPIRPGETAAQVFVRLHRIEHQLYPRALADVLTGRVQWRGGRVVRRADD